MLLYISITKAAKNKIPGMFREGHLRGPSRPIALNQYGGDKPCSDIVYNALSYVLQQPSRPIQG